MSVFDSHIAAAAEFLQQQDARGRKSVRIGVLHDFQKNPDQDAIQCLPFRKILPLMLRGRGPKIGVREEILPQLLESVRRVCSSSTQGLHHRRCSEFTPSSYAPLIIPFFSDCFASCDTDRRRQEVSFVVQTDRGNIFRGNFEDRAGRIRGLPVPSGQLTTVHHKPSLDPSETHSSSFDALSSPA